MCVLGEGAETYGSKQFSIHNSLSIGHSFCPIHLCLSFWVILPYQWYLKKWRSDIYCVPLAGPPWSCVRLCFNKTRLKTCSRFNGLFKKKFFTKAIPSLELAGVLWNGHPLNWKYHHRNSLLTTKTINKIFVLIVCADRKNLPLSTIKLEVVDINILYVSVSDSRHSRSRKPL